VLAIASPMRRAFVILKVFSAFFSLFTKGFRQLS
jgi:hypothetical protein